MLDLVLALLAGVLTIAAPCTLPVLPILLGASIGNNGTTRPAMIALGFVLSFSAVALLLTALTRIFDFDPSVLRSGAAILLLGFGAADDLAGAVRVAVDPAQRIDRKRPGGHAT